MRSFLLVVALRQTPGKENSTAAGYNVLPVVEFIGDGRAVDLTAGAGVPKGFAVGGVEGKNAAGGVAGECEACVRGQDAGRGAFADLVGPTDLAGLIVDGFDRAFAPKAIVCASPAISAVGGLGEIEGVTIAGGNDKYAGLGIETGRAIVGQASFIGRDQASV